MHASYHESTQVSYSKIRISLTFLIKVNDTELHMVNCIRFLSGEGALITTISNQWSALIYMFLPISRDLS